MEKKKKTSNIEENVRQRVARHQLKNAVVTSLYLTLGVGAVVMAPNAARLLKYVEKFVGPSPRLRERVSQKYSELIAQGILTRTKTQYGPKLKLTEKGTKIAEELAEREEMRPEKQKKWDQKWRIILFDVWERRRKVRDALRSNLKEFGFVKIQDSVWVYPYPCEKLLIFLRTYFKLGQGILYIVADEIEHDEKLRGHFNLPPLKQ